MLQHNMKLYPSKTTAFWVLLVLSCAWYARQALASCAETLGISIDLVVWSSLAVFALILAAMARHASPAKVLKTAILLAAVLIAAFNMEISVERMHLIKYGAMGFLYGTDIIRQNSGLKRRYAFSLATLFCTAVAAIDETNQLFIPNRVGDLRDVAFGGVSSMWGAAMALVIKQGQAPSQRLVH